MDACLQVLFAVTSMRTTAILGRLVITTMVYTAVLQVIHARYEMGQLQLTLLDSRRTADSVQGTSMTFLAGATVTSGVPVTTAAVVPTTPSLGMRRCLIAILTSFADNSSPLQFRPQALP